MILPRARDEDLSRICEKSLGAIISRHSSGCSTPRNGRVGSWVGAAGGNDGGDVYASPIVQPVYDGSTVQGFRCIPRDGARFDWG